MNVFQSTWVAFFSNCGWWSCTLHVLLLKRYHEPVSVDQLWPQSQLVWWITPWFFYHPVIGVLISLSQSVRISCTSSLYFPITSKMCLHDLKTSTVPNLPMTSEGQNVGCIKIPVTGIDWGIISRHSHIPTDTLHHVPPSNFDIGHLRKYRIPETLFYHVSSKKHHVWQAQLYINLHRVVILQAHSFGPFKSWVDVCAGVPVMDQRYCVYKWWITKNWTFSWELYPCFVGNASLHEGFSIAQCILCELRFVGQYLTKAWLIWAMNWTPGCF